VPGKIARVHRAGENNCSVSPHVARDKQQISKALMKHIVYIFFSRKISGSANNSGDKK
jgi:hypothetical protein